jgi:hypothetical protein
VIVLSEAHVQNEHQIGRKRAIGTSAGRVRSKAAQAEMTVDHGNRSAEKVLVVMVATEHQ